jgi:hypothetical protein
MFVLIGKKQSGEKIGLLYMINMQLIFVDGKQVTGKDKKGANVIELNEVHEV